MSLVIGSAMLSKLGFAEKDYCYVTIQEKDL